jgi:hypothetical protein
MCNMERLNTLFNSRSVVVPISRARCENSNVMLIFGLSLHDAFPTEKITVSVGYHDVQEDTGSPANNRRYGGCSVEGGGVLGARGGGGNEQLRGWETRGGPELTEQRTTCCLDAAASLK